MCWPCCTGQPRASQPCCSQTLSVRIDAPRRPDRARDVLEARIRTGGPTLYPKSETTTMLRAILITFAAMLIGFAAADAFAAGELSPIERRWVDGMAPV